MMAVLPSCWRLCGSVPADYLSGLISKPGGSAAYAGEAGDFGVIAWGGVSMNGNVGLRV